MRTDTAMVFEDFARFPWAQVTEGDNGFEVTLRDLRFFTFSRDRRMYVVDIQLDRELRVRTEQFQLSREPKASEY